MNIQQLKETHDNQNDLYIQGKGDLFAAGQIQDNALKPLAEDRLANLITVIDGISQEAMDAMPNYIEVIDCFVSFFDDVILECALITNRRKEIENKILNLCQKVLGKPTEEKTRDFDEEHVVCALIDGLVIHELPMMMRANTIKSAMLDDTNPLRLGQTFFEDFCVRYPEYADLPMLEYLKCELSLREKLINGDPAEASSIASKLMGMPINNSERFMLVAMVMFLNGVTSDATRILELGLNDFPGNERLLAAQRSLNG